MDLIKLRNRGVPYPATALFDDNMPRLQGTLEVADLQDIGTKRVMTLARWRTSPASTGLPPAAYLLDARLLWLNPTTGLMMLTGVERVRTKLGEAEYPQSWMIALDLPTLLPAACLGNGDLTRWEMMEMRDKGIPKRRSALADPRTYRSKGHCKVSEYFDPVTKRTMTVARFGEGPIDKENFGAYTLYDARLNWFNPENHRFVLEGFERPGVDNPRRAEFAQAWCLYMDRRPPEPEQAPEGRAGYRQKSMRPSGAPV